MSLDNDNFIDADFVKNAVLVDYVNNYADDDFKNKNKEIIQAKTYLENKEDDLRNNFNDYSKKVIDSVFQKADEGDYVPLIQLLGVINSFSNKPDDLSEVLSSADPINNAFKCYSDNLEVVKEETGKLVDYISNLDFPNDASSVSKQFFSFINLLIKRRINNSSELSNLKIDLTRIFDEDNAKDIIDCYVYSITKSFSFNSEIKDNITNFLAINKDDISLEDLSRFYVLAYEEKGRVFGSVPEPGWYEFLNKPDNPVLNNFSERVKPADPADRKIKKWLSDIDKYLIAFYFSIRDEKDEKERTSQIRKKLPESLVEDFNDKKLRKEINPFIETLSEADSKIRSNIGKILNSKNLKDLIKSDNNTDDLYSLGLNISKYYIDRFISRELTARIFNRVISVEDVKETFGIDLDKINICDEDKTLLKSGFLLHSNLEDDFGKNPVYVFSIAGKQGVDWERKVKDCCNDFSYDEAIELFSVWKPYLELFDFHESVSSNEKTFKRKNLDVRVLNGLRKGLSNAINSYVESKYFRNKRREQGSNFDERVYALSQWSNFFSNNKIIDTIKNLWPAAFFELRSISEDLFYENNELKKPIKELINEIGSSLRERFILPERADEKIKKSKSNLLKGINNYAKTYFDKLNGKNVDLFVLNKKNDLTDEELAAVVRSIGADKFINLFESNNIFTYHLRIKDLEFLRLNDNGVVKTLMEYGLSDDTDINALGMVLDGFSDKLSKLNKRVIPSNDLIDILDGGELSEFGA